MVDKHIAFKDGSNADQNPAARSADKNSNEEGTGTKRRKKAKESSAGGRGGEAATRGGNPSKKPTTTQTPRQVIDPKMFELPEEATEKEPVQLVNWASGTEAKQRKPTSAPVAKLAPRKLQSFQPRLMAFSEPPQKHATADDVQSLDNEFIIDEDIDMYLQQEEKLYDAPEVSTSSSLDSRSVHDERADRSEDKPFVFKPSMQTGHTTGKQDDGHVPQDPMIPKLVFRPRNTHETGTSSSISSSTLATAFQMPKLTPAGLTSIPAPSITSGNVQVDPPMPVVRKHSNEVPNRTPQPQARPIEALSLSDAKTRFEGVGERIQGIIASMLKLLESNRDMEQAMNEDFLKHKEVLQDQDEQLRNRWQNVRQAAGRIVAGI